MGALTTHILDTANGVPAAGVKIELWYIGVDDRTFIKAATTNKDGRLDAPAIEGDDFKAGQYELVFYIGDYFSKLSGDKPAFLDAIPIRFCVTDASSHYHVPLLVSPFGYSTYKGS